MGASKPGLSPRPPFRHDKKTTPLAVRSPFTPILLALTEEDLLYPWKPQGAFTITDITSENLLGAEPANDKLVLVGSHNM